MEGELGGKGKKKKAGWKQGKTRRQIEINPVSGMHGGVDGGPGWAVTFEVPALVRWETKLGFRRGGSFFFFASPHCRAGSGLSRGRCLLW